MDNILTVIITSVIVTIVSNIFIWWHKNNDYKRDYYKKIIDKRLKSYEDLQCFIEEFAISQEAVCKETGQNVGSGKFIFCCFLGRDELREAIEKLLKVVYMNMWFSGDLVKALREFNAQLVNAANFIDDPECINTETKNKIAEHVVGSIAMHIKVGIAMFDDISNTIECIRLQINEDLMDFSDVEGFLNKKSNN